VRAYKKDYGCGASVRGGNKSDCVFGRADKLSGIMPASQSINYEPAQALRARARAWAPGRSALAATNTPAVHFIDHPAGRFQVPRDRRFSEAISPQRREDRSRANFPRIFRLSAESWNNKLSIAARCINARISTTLHFLGTVLMNYRALIDVHPAVRANEIAPGFSGASVKRKTRSY